MTVLSNMDSELPEINVSNIEVLFDIGQKVGNIYWIPTNTLITITANIPLPDNVFMTIFEQVVDVNVPTNDIRRPATVENGIMTLQVKFKNSGNFILSSERLNKGLKVINAGFKLSPFRLEFDIYEEV